MLLHISVVMFVFQIPLHGFFPRTARAQSPRKIYSVERIVFTPALPSLRAPGPGGKPGRGSRPKLLPARGSDYHHPKLTIVSNPPRPDNARQTIVQPASPPDLIIPFEMSLPNIVVGGAASGPKLAVPISVKAPAAPRPKTSAPLTDIEAPRLTPTPTEFAQLIPTPLIEAPHLPVPPPPAGEPAAGSPQTVSEASAPGAATGSPTGATGTAGLLALSIQPGPISNSLVLPPGNRYGSFTISPEGGRPGSPGGVAGGDANGGSGAGGGAGDSSTGVGGGKSGGGSNHGVPSATPVVTIAGGREGVLEGTLSLDPVVSGVLSGRVYPVVVTPRVSANALTITAGPGGGGGLRVYGVLRGGKIYTAFLNMPGKNWTLQYCRIGELPGSEPAQTRDRTVVMETNVIAPLAEEQFDFRRGPLPPGMADQMIILHAVIREDGRIEDARVLQGVAAETDEAALLAFRRWKFRPAMQLGQPVAVEILVGIPALQSH
jgi:TonB family protein